MSPITRRTFLVAFGAAIPLGGIAAWLHSRFKTKPLTGSGTIPDSWKTAPPSTPWKPDEPFPHMEFFEPYPAGQPVFEKNLAVPSFLHPNGDWVILPGASGGFEVWDWRQGVPVRSIGGLHVSEHLKYPCGEDNQIPGCFTFDGNTWIHGRAWHGGDDGQALMGTGMDGSGSWDISVSDSVQIDPRRSVVHLVGRAWNSEDGGSCEGISEIDAETGEIRRVADLPPPLRSNGGSFGSGISPDGRWFIAWHPATGKTTPRPWGWWAIWSVADGRCRAYEASRYYQHPVFSLDGATAYITEKAWSWSGQETQSDPVSSLWSTDGMGPSSVKVDQGGIELVRMGEGILEIRSTKDQHQIRRLVAFPPNNALIAFGPKTNLLLAAPPSGTPWLWNRNAPVRKLNSDWGEEYTHHRPGFSPLGCGLARALAWSSDGTRIAVGNDRGQINLFDPRSFRVPNGKVGDETSLGAPTRTLSGFESAIRGLAFTAKGLFALAQDGTIGVWEGEDQSPVRTWKVHPSRSNSLQLSIENRLVATGSLDGVALWSMDDGEFARRLGTGHSGVSCLHVAAGGKWLAATYLDGWLALFELRTGKVLWEVQAHEGVAAAVAFHPTGDWLVTLGWDGRIKRWQARNGMQESSHQAPTAAGCLAWSRDGKWLGVGGSSPVVMDVTLTRRESELSFLWDADCT